MKRIFGVVVVAEDAAADAPHHRAMPPHKGGKSRRVTTAGVVLQQLLIGPSSPIPQKHRPAKVLDNPAQLVRSPYHFSCNGEIRPLSYYYRLQAV